MSICFGVKNGQLFLTCLNLCFDYSFAVILSIAIETVFDFFKGSFLRIVGNTTRILFV